MISLLRLITLTHHLMQMIFELTVVYEKNSQVLKSLPNINLPTPAARTTLL
jgi:hypothetical protein